MIVPVVLSGGFGSRLWPVSRRLFPKQFHALTGDRTLLVSTVSRAIAATGNRQPLIVCNNEHRFVVAEQLQQTLSENAPILLEPVARNTAPAVAAAGFYLERNQPGATMLVLPSDHLIEDENAFAQSVARATRIAARGYLVTFGIVPSRAETGYGYILRGPLLDDGPDPAFVMERFVEKPDAATAEKYVRDGHYFWNSGMFVLPVELFLEELRKYEPGVYECAKQAVAGAARDGEFLRLDEAALQACPVKSVDYAVMERTRRAAVVAFDGQWSDVGSWSSIAKIEQPDSNGNVAIGDVVTHMSENTYVKSENRLVAAVGIRNTIVVATDDAVLVLGKNADQDVKTLVNRLVEQKRSEIESHTTVYRPWGSFQNLDRGERFQVKRLIIKPGASISLQKHNKRSEHWVVVKGVATVTRGDEIFELQTNQSTYIPLGTRHKLENRAADDLEIVEIQTGHYLGEDDIERFEDQYGRK